MTKEERLDKMKKISAEIGKCEIMRKQGIYVPMGRIIKLKKEFQKLSVAHRQESFNF